MKQQIGTVRGTSDESGEAVAAHQRQPYEFNLVPDNKGSGPSVLVSIVMPCLNEVRTLDACIEQARTGCQAALLQRHQVRRAPIAGKEANGALLHSLNDTPVATYEILVADNGSTDGSLDVAAEHGARIVHVAKQGYGAALLGGIAASQGQYVVMGDCDCSYDFGEVAHFLNKLEEGYDLVVGNRFTGGIKPGAMPWHHRYVGNPVLSGIGRLLYRTSCRDWHCGMRAFDRKAVQQLNLKCSGMEFASEIIICASQAKLRITEMPITLWPDRRGRAPHLRSVRDGLRHLLLLIAGKLFRNKA